MAKKRQRVCLKHGSKKGCRARKAPTAAQKRWQNKFAESAKECRTEGNYGKCMKAMLKSK